METSSEPTSAQRLNFTRIKFCGRRDELQVLQNAFDRISAPQDPQACSVLLEGESGTGKSTLVRAFRELVLSKTTRTNELDEPCFCRGKFEEGRAAAEPFAAVAQAINSMMKQLLVDEFTLEEWRDRFIEELSRSDSAIVKDFIPALRNVLPDYDSDSEEEDDDSFASGSSRNRSNRSNSQRYQDTQITASTSATSEANPGFSQLSKEWGFERLRFALRSLIRTVSKFIPLVVFLDDLQWSGEDSLMLIQTLASDQSLDRRLLFVGAFRPVDASHPLSRHLLSSLDDKSTLLSIVIHLPNLDESEISDMLASFLLVEDEGQIRSLVSAILCYQKISIFMHCRNRWSHE